VLEVWMPISWKWKNLPVWIDTFKTEVPYFMKVTSLNWDVHVLGVVYVRGDFYYHAPILFCGIGHYFRGVTNNNAKNKSLYLE
jgi:hypothetical protein